jgi:NAD-dependent dihydropyrimidine dehydrogenase PreA subunit/DNA-binding Lrp family transcriptional regulator
MEPIDIIAKRVGLSVEEAGVRLGKMAERGLLWFHDEAGKSYFRLAPFVVGIYEAQLESMDHELAHLVEEYLANGGAAGIMKPQPAIHRVVPAQNAVKSEWILPYDDVQAILLRSKTFRLQDCICRVQQDHIGRKCDFPLRTCLSFSSNENPPHPNDISQKEALAFLDKAEEIGLVHTVSNVMKGVGYVCNCCGCCCGILRGITEWGIKTSVAYANYYAVINPDECLGCGTCRKRCQVHAISEQNGVSVVNLEKCIGCGLCVTGCPNGAAKLQRKPDDEIVNPPVDFATWEHERLRNRGLSE